LITHLLKKAGKKVYYCGNTTGISPYQFWNQEDAIFVVELSSFQLQDLQNINPKVSVITNYYVDHQDQHTSLEEYWKAKDRIFETQNTDSFAIFNQQIKEYSEINTKAQKIIVNQKLVNFINQRVKSPLIGEHNQYNMTLAIASVLCFLDNDFDISNLSIWAEKLTDYIQVEMRLEKFMLNDKVTVYDDGAATEPQAVISATKTLTANLKNNQKLWLWVSGKDKGGDLTELANLIKTLENKIKVEYCGEVGQNLAKLVGVNLAKKQSLKQKLEELKIGDFEGNICLSPCGSSFDEFANYKERSALWKETFKKLLKN
jgi:UDP-N-acetylmuramoylalanine--D-glutamate ligase